MTCVPKFAVIAATVWLAGVASAFLTEPPDRGWYFSSRSGDYGIIEWNSKTYIAFGHHALRIPLPMYPTIGLMFVAVGAVCYPIYMTRAKKHETT